jgi:hypothetical protein
MRRLMLPLLVIGCASPETVTIPPLPVGEERIVFSDGVARIRAHSEAATEAFYRDEWENVAASARRIEETTTYLNQSRDLPVHLTKTLPDLTIQLTQESRSMINAANAKDPKGVGESLSKIRFVIRSLQAKRS